MTNTKEIVNRRAKHEYHFLTTIEAGIVLTGPEVKSIRQGHVSLSDAYCVFDKGELWVRSMYIKPYEQATFHTEDERRPRKLLLKKGELKKLHRRVKEKGLTIVPYRLYFSDRNLVKVEIALAQGKKSYDKRESIKAKDTKRDLARLNKIRL
ncbi:MAG: SsrA-binding protein [Saprospirales bacterium]|jgi:SsrA-binding protein|nr:SsrA-binding protein [Saprospirales bacterium]